MPCAHHKNKRPYGSLLALLLALALSQAPLPVQAQQSVEMQARPLINALGCKSCHSLEGDGGSLAPELDKIGSRMTLAEIRDVLAAHVETRKNGFMPSYSTTSPTELTNLSDFLYNLR
jgi:hypothetical protein